MKTSSIAALGATFFLCACGGGGGGGGNGSGGTGGNASANYSFVAPKQGQTQSYVYNLTDAAGDQGTYRYTETISQVNSDGSFIANWVPAQSTYPVSSTITGQTYPETDTYGSNGEIAQYSPDDNGIINNCTYTYASAKPVQMVANQSWNGSYSYQCSNSSTVQNQTVTGTFLGIESVTVPAGTFNAYKFQYTGSYPVTNASGASMSYVMTLWLDADPASSRRLKTSTQYTPSGYTPPPSGPLLNVMQLSSYQ